MRRWKKSKEAVVTGKALLLKTAAGSLQDRSIRTSTKKIESFSAHIRPTLVLLQRPADTSKAASQSGLDHASLEKKQDRRMPNVQWAGKSGGPPGLLPALSPYPTYVSYGDNKQLMRRRYGTVLASIAYRLR